MTQEGKVRRSTRAPCRQPKTKARAATKPYARLDPRQPQQRTSALPYPGIESADDVEGVLGRDRADILAWIDDVASSQLGGVASRRRTRASCSWPSTWLEAEEKEEKRIRKASGVAHVQRGSSIRLRLRGQRGKLTSQLLNSLPIPSLLKSISVVRIRS